MQTDWLDKMVSFYSEGYSDAEVCRELGISKKQFRSYIERSPVFADWVDYGHDLAEAWALKQNREFITKSDVSAQNVKALEKRLENMHGWTTKVESKNSNSNSDVDIEKLKLELESLMPEMLKSIGQDKLALQIGHERVIDHANEG